MIISNISSRINKEKWTFFLDRSKLSNIKFLWDAILLNLEVHCPTVRVVEFQLLARERNYSRKGKKNVNSRNKNKGKGNEEIKSEGRERNFDETSNSGYIEIVARRKIEGHDDECGGGNFKMWHELYLKGRRNCPCPPGVRGLVKRVLIPNMKLFRRYQQEILQRRGQECGKRHAWKEKGEIEKREGETTSRGNVIPLI